MTTTYDLEVEIGLFMKTHKSGVTVKQAHDAMVAKGWMDETGELGRLTTKNILFKLRDTGRATVKTEKGIDIFYPNEAAKSVKTLPAKQPQPAGMQPTAATVTVLVQVRAEKAQTYADALNDLSYLLAPPIAEMCAEIGNSFTRALNVDDISVFAESLQ